MVPAMIPFSTVCVDLCFTARTCAARERRWGVVPAQRGRYLREVLPVNQLQPIGIYCDQYDWFVAHPSFLSAAPIGDLGSDSVCRPQREQ